MDRPDVVLITVDSLRADAVGYRGGAASTPNVDAFADRATMAATATAPSSHTRASVPAILTSQYAHNFFSNFLQDVDERTVAQYLSDAGYETAAFHSNPLLSRHFGYDRGFDVFHDGLRFVEHTRLPETVTRAYSKVVRLLRRYPYQPAGQITDLATEWLSETPSPFFLWVHYMDPHGPYALDRERGYFDKFRSERLWHRAVSSPASITDEERERLREAYVGEIAYTDGFVGDLLDAVDEQSTEAVVALTGDHGEEFREHGEFTHMPKLYEEVTHVPLMLDLPDVAGPAAPSGPLTLLDVVPTVLGRVDGLTSSTDSFAGVDLGPHLDGERLDRSHVVAETNPDDGVSVAVREERWKYIATGDRRELYDLEADPGEQNECRNDHPEAARRLEEALTAHLSSHDVSGGDKLATEAATMNDEMRDRLEDLGYL